MNVVITYSEVSDLLEKRFGIRPEITNIDNKTFELSYKPAAFLPSIGLKFHVETICTDTISLSYDCIKAASLVITGAVAYLKDKIPNGVEIDTAEQVIYIYPKHFSGIEKVLSHIELSDLNFESGFLDITIVAI